MYICSKQGSYKKLKLKFKNIKDFVGGEGGEITLFKNISCNSEN